MNNSVDLSVVLPAYNEAENLSCLLPELEKIIFGMGLNFEIIVVDDGSSDNSREIIAEASKRNAAIKGLFLSRNFGHQAALNAGLDFASGEVVIVMDADFQHPPSLIPEMHKLCRDGNDIILCVREKNEKGRLIKNKASRFFYLLMSKIVDFNLRSNIADFGLYSRTVIDTLKRMPEKDRFLRGLVQWVGFKKAYLNYEVGERRSGKRGYTFKKSLNLAISGITSFSAVPLRMSLWVGFFMAAFGFVYLVFILIKYFFYPSSLVSGWASAISVVIIIGGLQLIILGIMGEYLYRIYNEIKGRPLYIVREKVGFNNEIIKSNYGIDNK